MTISLQLINDHSCMGDNAKYGPKDESTNLNKIKKLQIKASFIKTL